MSYRRTIGSDLHVTQPEDVVDVERMHPGQQEVGTGVTTEKNTASGPGVSRATSIERATASAVSGSPLWNSIGTAIVEQFVNLDEDMQPTKDAPLVRLRYTVGRYPSDQNVAEAIAGMLEGVGFRVERLPLDGATFFQEKNTDTWDGAFLHVSRVVFPHPSLYVGAYLLPTSTSHYCQNPAYERLNAEGLAAESESEMVEAYREIERLTTGEDICWVNLYEQVMAFGVKDEVEGFVATRDELIKYTEISVASS